MASRLWEMPWTSIIAMQALHNSALTKIDYEIHKYNLQIWAGLQLHFCIHSTPGSPWSGQETL